MPNKLLIKVKNLSSELVGVVGCVVMVSWTANLWSRAKLPGWRTLSRTLLFQRCRAIFRASFIINIEGQKGCKLLVAFGPKLLPRRDIRTAGLND